MILDAGICFYGIMGSMFFATSWIANQNLIEISAYQEENHNKLGKKHFIDLVHKLSLRLQNLCLQVRMGNPQSKAAENMTSKDVPPGIY